jgi:hypothetical protein
MKVQSIHLGMIEASEVEPGLKALAQELGYAALQDNHKVLTNRINNASQDEPVDIVDERELEEVIFMMKEFQDEEGYAKENIPF